MSVRQINQEHRCGIIRETIGGAADAAGAHRMVTHAKNKLIVASAIKLN